MLIVCASVSGAPGVSTTAVGLAATWPVPGAVLLEADPSGGVAAARFGLAQQPGLSSLAAVARHGHAVGLATEHRQRLPLGVDAVVAPGSADTAAGSVAVLSRHAHTALPAAAVVVADVGRLFPGSPAGELLRVADVVVLVVSPVTEYLDHLDARMPWLQETTQPDALGLVLSGTGPFPAGEVGLRLGAPVFGQVPRDRWGAGVLSGRLVGRSWHRTRLVRAVKDLATILHAQATSRAEPASPVVVR
jgi:hypothetical protein